MQCKEGWGLVHAATCQAIAQQLVAVAQQWARRPMVVLLDTAGVCFTDKFERCCLPLWSAAQFRPLIIAGYEAGPQGHVARLACGIPTQLLVLPIP
jgi:hypothetical protein